jgi:hypothetical protein
MEREEALLFAEKISKYLKTEGILDEYENNMGE